MLDIDYTSGHGKRIRRPFVPLKTEYSPKNDKFRLYCLMLRGGGRVSYAIINLGRITQINETPMIWDKPVNAEEPQAKECAEIRITPERNAVERFMMEFASYRKHTERDLETGICTVKLWYDNRDETELLIRLLGFGPVLEILGSENLRKQAAERVFKQKALLTPND